MRINFLNVGLDVGLYRKEIYKPLFLNTFIELDGGGGGIRTHGRVAPSSVFKTGAFNHSATPPIRG